jgi:hypothetical protein
MELIFESSDCMELLLVLSGKFFIIDSLEFEYL